MLDVERGLKSLQAKQVWGEGELVAFLAAEGNGLLGGLAYLTAAFISDAWHGGKDSAGVAAPIHDASKRIEAAIKLGHLPFHWRHTQHGRGRAFRREDIQRWMKSSGSSIPFSGLMRQIFTPEPTPEEVERKAWAEAFAKHCLENPDGEPPPLPSYLFRGSRGQQEAVPSPVIPKVPNSATADQILVKASSPINMTDQGSSPIEEALQEGQALKAETRAERLTRLDHELTTLSDRDRDRLLCRAVAREIWDQAPRSNIADVVRHPRIQAVTGGSWGGRDTLRNWVKDLDPRSPKAKSGPGRPVPPSEN